MRIQPRIVLLVLSLFELPIAAAYIQWGTIEPCRRTRASKAASC
jgi:hypothetical protein